MFKDMKNIFEAHSWLALSNCASFIRCLALFSCAPLPKHELLKHGLIVGLTSANKEYTLGSTSNFYLNDKALTNTKYL